MKRIYISKYIGLSVLLIGIILSIQLTVASNNKICAFNHQYLEGESWIDNTTLRCKRCACYPSGIICGESNKCPAKKEGEVCYTRNLEAGECCPKCIMVYPPNGCRDKKTGEIYKHGDRWPSHDESCELCTCTKSGKIICDTPHCGRSKCRGKKTVRGCCGIDCEDDDYNTKQLKACKLFKTTFKQFATFTGQCVDQACMCFSGTKISCTVFCPLPDELPCPKSEQITWHTSCCTRCKGKESCAINGKLIKPNEEVVLHEKKCVCLDGRIQCPALDNVYIWVNKTCFYPPTGKQYNTGDRWQSAENPYEECSCFSTQNYGCGPRTCSSCPIGQRIQGECCPYNVVESQSPVECSPSCPALYKLSCPPDSRVRDNTTCCLRCPSHLERGDNNVTPIPSNRMDHSSILTLRIMGIVAAIICVLSTLASLGIYFYRRKTCCLAHPSSSPWVDKVELLTTSSQQSTRKPEAISLTANAV